MSLRCVAGWYTLESINATDDLYLLKLGTTTPFLGQKKDNSRKKTKKTTEFHFSDDLIGSLSEKKETISKETIGCQHVRQRN